MGGKTRTIMVLGPDALDGAKTIDPSSEEWGSLPREAPKSAPGHYFIAAEARLRDQMLKETYIKDLASDLVACYHREGVNHRQNCSHLVKAYKKAVDGPGILIRTFPDPNPIKAAQ